MATKIRNGFITTGNSRITGSLTVTVGVTSSFTGSYIGDGAGLYNIPASGIVGLNLSQISSGSVSASISPASGLQVNTNVTATSFTGSLSGSASTSTSASYAITASYVENAQTASYVLQAVSSSFATSASYALTASFATTTTMFIRRSDYTSSLDVNINYLYLGEAVSGSSESSDVWTISQLSISSSGATVTRVTSSAAWSNRYSYIYS
jgi:hypothetical protein